VEPSAVPLKRDNIRRPKPTVTLPVPRRAPILLREGQLPPEGILIPGATGLLAHDLISHMIYFIYYFECR
jgi:hypothetical protein